MSESKFKTLRHIETVRNYLNKVISELLDRSEHHDKTKLESPEAEQFEKYTPLLRDTTYGSDKYKKYMGEMSVAIKHHNEHNSHHPEHFINGIHDMTLIDLIEMLCDWKAATLRHNDGDIIRSIDINQQRFGYSNELKNILVNTANWINSQRVFHKAIES
ncbi:MAG: DUF5662 family protein [Nitrospirae bacterium YQR-1]